MATSIGEEGLDIGEIDRIICYDSQKTPLRMVCFFSNGENRSLTYVLLSFNVLEEQGESEKAMLMSYKPRDESLLTGLNRWKAMKMFSDPLSAVTS